MDKVFKKECYHPKEKGKFLVTKKLFRDWFVDYYRCSACGDEYGLPYKNKEELK